MPRTLEVIQQLQPLTRQLEEQLNWREYGDAEKTANAIADIANDVVRYCIAATVRSGEGAL